MGKIEVSKEMIAEYARAVVDVGWLENLLKMQGDKIRELETEVKHLKEMGLFQVRFDGPPDHDAGRFIETEDQYGAGIGLGEWAEEEDGTWLLRVDISRRRR